MFYCIEAVFKICVEPVVKLIRAGSWRLEDISQSRGTTMLCTIHTIERKEAFCLLQPIEWAVAGCLGSLMVVAILVLRIYLGWAYVGDRLLSAAVPYEETGWYVRVIFGSIVLSTCILRCCSVITTLIHLPAQDILAKHSCILRCISVASCAIVLASCIYQ